jgi:hypothetical protein
VGGLLGPRHVDMCAGLLCLLHGLKGRSEHAHHPAGPHEAVALARGPAGELHGLVIAAIVSSLTLLPSLEPR